MLAPKPASNKGIGFDDIRIFSAFPISFLFLSVLVVTYVDTATFRDVFLAPAAQKSHNQVTSDIGMSKKK